MEPIRINIATFEYLDKKIVLIIAALVVTIAIMTALNTSLYLTYNRQIGEFEQKTSRVEKSIQKDSGKTDISAEEWETTQRRIISANRIIIKDVIPWSRLFEVLEKNIPDGIFIESVKPTNDFRTVIIQGKATSERKISLFMKRLKEVEFLKNSLLAEFSIGADDGGRFKKEGANIGFRLKSDLLVENLFEQKAYRPTIKETMALPEAKNQRRRS
jgi:hypothetical protein